MVFASVTAPELVLAKGLWWGRNVRPVHGDSLGSQRQIEKAAHNASASDDLEIVNSHFIPGLK